MSTNLTPTETVTAATSAIFGSHDLAGVDTYFGPTFVQHSTLAGDGTDGLKALVRSLADVSRYVLARIFAEGELVVTHGTYYGPCPQPIIGFDVWRLDGGKIVEHWDALTPIVGNTTSGRTQTDGPTGTTDLDKTGANKTLVADFADAVLIGADYSKLSDYISTAGYNQHNVEAADGLAGFGEAAEKWAADGKILKYEKVHHIIAEGDFVFTRSEGDFGVPSIYNDLWRVQDGKIVEHWDVILPVPSALPHTNGVF